MRFTIRLETGKSSIQDNTVASDASRFVTTWFVPAGFVTMRFVPAGPRG